MHRISARTFACGNGLNRIATEVDEIVDQLLAGQHIDQRTDVSPSALGAPTITTVRGLAGLIFGTSVIWRL
jgi:hypothetical protein